jgi:hypothetical protein
MGWQDDPITGGQSAASLPSPTGGKAKGGGGGWQDDPVAGPQAGAVAPSATAQAAPDQPQDLGVTALWNKPADVSWSDYMLAHLGQQFGGPGGRAKSVGEAVQNVGQSADDYVRAITDAGSFGLADRGASWLSGNSLTDEQAKTAAAYDRLGTMGYVAGAIGQAPYAELGVGAKALSGLTPYVGRFLANRAAGAAEQGALGVAGALGHGDDPTQSGLISGGLGAILGPFAKLRGGGASAAPAATVADLRGQATEAYKPLDRNYFNTHGDALDGVTSAIKNERDPLNQGTSLNIPTDVNKIVSDLTYNPTVTGGNIQKAATDLRNTGTWEGNRYADALVGGSDTTGRWSGKVDGMLATEKPIQAGGVVGDAARALEAGNALHGQANDLERINTMQNLAALPGGQSVGQQTRNWMQTEGGQQLMASNPNLAGTMTALGKTGKPYTLSDMLPNPWESRHALYGPLGGMIATGAVGGASGQDPSRIAEEMLAGALGGYVAHKLPVMTAPLYRNPKIAGTIASAKQAAGTGNPFAYQGPIRAPGALTGQDGGVMQALRFLLAQQSARGQR